MKNPRWPRIGTYFLLVFLLVFAFSEPLPTRAQKPPSTPCCQSALEIGASRSVQLLVIGPNGFETGYDPLVSGNMVNQIPSSDYYLGLAGDGLEGSQEAQAERKIEIGTPAPGRYLVQAIGALSGRFMVKFKATGENGAIRIRTFSGTVRPGQTYFYAVRYSPARGARFGVTALSPFSDLSANMTIRSGPPATFDLKAEFDLGVGSSGLDPVDQPVSFQLASYAATIPAGSFVRDPRGTYHFDGTIEGIDLKVRMAPEGGSKFGFVVQAHGIGLSDAINPIRLTLIVGGNAGATEFNAVSP